MTTTAKAPEPIYVPSASEEPAAYQRALLEIVGDQKPLDVLATTPARVREAIAAIHLDQADQTPVPQEWSIADALGHLYDVDIVYGFRFRLVLTEDRPAYPGYDEKLWSALPRLPFWQTLNAWESLRAANVALLRNLTAEQLDRVGVHGEQGAESLEVMIRKIAGHDIAHLNQIIRTFWAVRS